jgi:hypothetical protein
MSTKHSRRLCVAAVVAAALLGAAPAVTAATITFTGYEYGSANVQVGTVTPSLPLTTISAGAFNTKVDSGPTFESWCADLWQTLSFNTAYSLGAGQTYTYQPSMVGYVTAARTLTQATVDDLSRLYTQAHTAIVGNSSNSAALQLAMWEVLFETSGSYDLAAGNVFAASSPIRATATAWLTNLGSYSPDYVVSGYVSTSRQDVIVFAPVPEPGTYALLLAGLGMMGFIMRRRTGNPS